MASHWKTRLLLYWDSSSLEGCLWVVATSHIHPTPPFRYCMTFEMAIEQTQEQINLYKVSPTNWGVALQDSTYLHHKSRHVKFSPKGVGHSSWAVFLSIRYLITSNTSGAKPWLYDILTRTVFKLTDRRRWFWFRGIHSRFTEIEIDSCRPTILLIKRWLKKMVRKPCSLQHGKVMQYYVTSKKYS